MANENIEQSIDMETFHRTTKTMNVQNQDIDNLSITPSIFNINANNKNLLSKTGILILTSDCLLLAYFAYGSRRGWLTLYEARLGYYMHLYVAPIILPMVYFMFNPDHLISVLKDLNWF